MEVKPGEGVSGAGGWESHTAAGLTDQADDDGLSLCRHAMVTLLQMMISVVVVMIALTPLFFWFWPQLSHLSRSEIIISPLGCYGTYGR